MEKQRGFNEPGFVSTPAGDEGRATPSPEPVKREASLPVADAQSQYRRPSTSLSIRDDARQLIRSRTPTSEDVTEQDEPSTLPTLFDIYSDSSKVTIAQAIDESASSRLTRPRKSNASHIIPAHIHEERRGSVESLKGERVQTRSGRNSLSQGPFQKKIFALSNNGLILQYSEKGGGERLPERALQLCPESVAFACDLVPGRPYVLQVDQKLSASNEPQALPTQSLLTKIGLKDNLPRVGDHSMLLILETAEELTSWMNAVRKQILVLGAAVEDDAKESSLEMQTAIPPKLRVRQRASMSQQDQPSFTNFSFPKGSGTESLANTRPRRESSAAIMVPCIQSEPAELRSRRNSNTPAVRKLASERDGKDRLKKMASFDTTGSRDSPLSVSTHDSAISFGADSRKRVVRDKNASQKSSMGSLNDEFGTDSPILPRSMTTGTLERPKPNTVVDRPRPDSFVADLPLLWPARKPSESKAVTSRDPSNSPPVKRLPLKVNPTSSGISVPRQRASHSPLKAGPPPSRALPSIPKNVENFSRKPQRSPSVKLSLFPTSDLAVPASAPPTVKPLPPSPNTPSEDPTRSLDRPLRRPASIQIRTNHAPFLSSIRPMTSTTRPQLSKAESVPCLRNASTLPRAPQVQKPSSSPLPPLDLGIPIVALAPPAPPPSLPLPKLPPGAQQKALAV